MHHHTVVGGLLLACCFCDPRLGTHLPQWAGFQIAACGKYLGFWVGLASDSARNFQAPLQKLKDRTINIAQSRLPPSQTALAYNMRAVTATSRVAHLQPLPRKALEIESWAATKLFRLPGSTLYAGLAAAWLPKGWDSHR